MTRRGGRSTRRLDAPSGKSRRLGAGGHGGGQGPRTEIAIEASNKLFELAGTRSTLAEYNLDRHWRNARTHTLHDPVRWKYAILGDYFLNGKNPPLHAWS